MGLTVVSSGCGAIQGKQSSPSSAAKHLLSVAIAPPNAALALGNHLQFSATALFSDGSKTDITSTATWISAQPNVAVISAPGMATTKGIGDTSISAVYESISGSSTLTVAPSALVSMAVMPQAVSLTPNHSVQLSATGTFTDGSSRDLSSSVTWSASPGGIVAVSSNGLATGKGLGASTVIAVLNSVSATDAVAVVAPTLNSISIAPSGGSIPLGGNQQLSAIGTYNDGSTQDLTSSVQWFSSNPIILSFSSAGLAAADSLGTVTVTATLGTISATSLLQVNPPVIVSFSVAPSNNVIALGAHQQLSVIATLSDGTTQDMTTSVSWSSADPSIANVSNQGLLLAEQVGQTTISVSSNSVAGSASVTVKPVLAVSYFSNAHTSGTPDATVRLTNPGITGGNLCAQIYVFDQDQQLSECCGCLVSRDGLLTLSVNTDLTGNPLTGSKSKNGVVKIVSADASGNASCNPSSIAPDASLAAWSTNIQKQNASSFAITETSFQLGPLGDDELAALQSQCSFSSTLGSGQGVCSCGTVVGGGTEGTP
ncbi:MAG: Ig-like domain-containing protein [Candidatus Sulfotelmatobacter sp.]